MSDVSDFFEKVSKDDIQYIDEQIVKRIEHEYSLMGSRVGWLVSANAFLFTPIAVMLADGSLSLVELQYVCLLNLTGLILAIMILLLVVLALRTIKSMKHRQKILFENANELSVARRFVNPDLGVTENWPEKRPARIHIISVRLGWLIPTLFIFVWLAVGFFVITWASSTEKPKFELNIILN